MLKHNDNKLLNLQDFGLLQLMNLNQHSNSYLVYYKITKNIIFNLFFLIATTIKLTFKLKIIYYLKISPYLDIEVFVDLTFSKISSVIIYINQVLK